MKRRLLLVLLTGPLLPSLLTGQPAGTIPFTNPSFEGEPRPDQAPAGWTDCDAAGTGAVDTYAAGSEGVHLSPAGGSSFVGLLVHDDGDREALGQALSSPLQPDRCYRLQVRVARAEPFASTGGRRKKAASYVTPAILRVWGGTGTCDRRLLLAESAPVVNVGWEPLTLYLRPKAAFTHLLLEVYYAPFSDGYYNGNLMLDDLQPLEIVDCETRDGAGAEPAATLSTEMPPAKLPLPTDRAGLKTFLQTNGATLRFQQQQPVPLRDYFPDEQGEEIHRSRALYLAVRALRAFPEETLLIAVDLKEHPAKPAQIFDALAYELRRLNAPDNIRVERFKKGDAEEDWLWRRETNALFRMRLLKEDE